MGDLRKKAKERYADSPWDAIQAWKEEMRKKFKRWIGKDKQAAMGSMAPKQGKQAGREGQLERIMRKP